MGEANLGALRAMRRLGTEQFHADGQPLGPTLLEFWQWCSSDLASNALRGVLAEFLVASALGVAQGMRTEWDAYDLTAPSGAKVEVKSAAYLQSWVQARLSAIVFGIQPTIGWDASTDSYDIEPRRQADVYVFALLKHQDKGSLDPLNVEQWAFSVLLTRVLDEQLPTQKTISLATLRRLQPRLVGFAQLATAIEEAFAQSRR